MSYSVGGIEYNVDVGTNDLINGRREVGRFGDAADREFRRSTTEAGKLSTKMKAVASSIRSAFTVTAVIGFGAVIAGTMVAIAALGKNIADAAKELGILARQANLSVTEFEKLSAATSQFGINGEQIADISKDITDKLGEFSKVGTGAFQDFADTVGMSTADAQKFANGIQHLSGREVLLELTKRMEAAGASGAQMTFVLESMGSDASRLLPLLINNGKALKEMEKRFDKTGTSMEMTQEKMEKLSKMSGAFDAVNGAISAMGTTLMTQFAPFFTRWADGAISLIKQLTGWLFKFNNELMGIEPVEFLAELENDAVNATGEVAKLKKEITDLQKDIKENGGDGTFDMDIPDLGSGGYKVGDAEKKLKQDLAKQEKLLNELNLKIAAIKKKNGGDDKKLKDEEDAKKLAAEKTFERAQLKIKQTAALQKIAVIEGGFKSEFEATTNYLAELASYTNTAMDRATVAEKNRHEKSLSMLKEKYEEAARIAKENGVEGGESDSFDQSSTSVAYQKALEEEVYRNEMALKTIEENKQKARDESLASAKDYFAKEMEQSISFNEINKEFQGRIFEDEFVAEAERHTQKMEEMKARFEEENLLLGEDAILKAELAKAFEDAKEQERIASMEKMKALDKEEMEARKEIVKAGYAAMAGAASGFFGALAGIMDSGTNEQSNAYKAMFALQKGFAVAQAGLNLQQAISNASSVSPWQAKAAAISEAVTSGASFLSAVKGATYSGGRRYGGPVSPNSMYEVNEAGVPEIVSAGGKDFMTMGSTGGKVTPLDKAGLGGNVIINNYGNDSVTSEKVNNDWVVNVAREEASKAAQGAYNRVAGDFRDNKGRVFDSASQNGSYNGKAGTGR